MNTNTISYGSVCSGIEAASVAWEVLGFSPAWFSQFDPEHKYKNGPDFPSAVLAHHWPEVPNLGDMTKLAAKMRAGYPRRRHTMPGVFCGRCPRWPFRPSRSTHHFLRRISGCHRRPQSSSWTSTRNYRLGKRPRSPQLKR